MTLPVNNLPVSNILSDLGVASKKAKDIFYNSNGTLKSELELGNMVNGSLNSSYCPNLATLRTRRNLASFKGYSPTSLSLSLLSITKRSNSLSTTTVNVYGVVSYTLSYNSSLIRVLQYPNYFTVNWMAVNTSISSQKQTTITVTGGGKSEKVTVKQLVRPYINGLPSSIVIKDFGHSKTKEIHISSNYYSDWNVVCSSSSIRVEINLHVLKIFLPPKLPSSGSVRCICDVSLDGVNYRFGIMVES